MRCPYQPSVAAVLLGVTDPGERRLVHLHLRMCPGCSRVRDELAGVVPLLASAPPDWWPGGGPGPGDGPVEGTATGAGKPPPGGFVRRAAGGVRRIVRRLRP